MRAIFEYDVYGEDYAHVIEEATRKYQNAMGAPTVALPSSTTIHMNQIDPVENENGYTYVWKAHVHISTAK